MKAKILVVTMSLLSIWLKIMWRKENSHALKAEVQLGTNNKIKDSYT